MSSGSDEQKPTSDKEATMPRSLKSYTCPLVLVSSSGLGLGIYILQEMSLSAGQG